MILFRNGATADVISQDEVILKQSRPLIQYDSCPCRKKGKQHVSKEAETGMIQLHAKKAKNC